ncbi:hypothetical protein OH77DRAFT_1416041 [Trametes cingulata]|nr:hypothetical protein OH77DRAFT_1416041 [Trametes cingulata]
MGYSLWLVPRTSQAAKIKHTMRLGRSPPFPPHVTLVSQYPDAAALLAALPSGQREIPVRFKSLEGGDERFRCVYVVVDSDSPSELETLRAHLRQKLGERPIPRVWHMSLYYTADVEERERLVERLRGEQLVREIGEGKDKSVSLVGLDDDVEGEQESELMDGFEGEEIWLVDCVWPIAEWEVLERVKLMR